jgi:glycosyltransferase involved in cell wall biosynthesis
MQSPFFSVILPTYNRANMIGRAIESVIAQTYTNWELLVVDDGSTDNTKQVVEAYNDSRIRYIYQENAERSAARNNGIDNAKGEYVCFIDSDDYYFDNHLQTFDEEIKNNQIVDVFFGYNVVENEGVLKNSKPSKSISDFNTLEEYLVKFPLRLPATAIRRGALADNKFNLNIRIGEDIDLFVRLTQKHTFKLIEAFTQVYTIHDEQSVHANSHISYIEHINTIKYIFTHNKSRKIFSHSFVRNGIAECYLRLARVCFRQQKYWQGLKAIIISSAYSPCWKYKEKIYLIISNIKRK